MKTSKDAVLLGIGGWEHDVLSRCLYGDGNEPASERLARYASIFDIGEVRATFWDDTLGPDDAGVGRRGVGQPAFQFCDQDALSPRTVGPQGIGNRMPPGNFRELAPGGGSWSACSVPVPFTSTSGARYHPAGSPSSPISGLVELRHDSWSQPDLYSSLKITGCMRSATTPARQSIHPSCDPCRGPLLQISREERLAVERQRCAV
jgi:hypothetical protein